ncbi:MAG: helix-turn-helix transcriptional regulator [Oscillospiraceae bacterium]|nr:helix-turn-helix transcriptional regulator [Oscillospiraceae bacterium]
MLPENAAVTVTDVLYYHQKQGHFNVPKRSFSAISLRLNTNGKYIFNNKSLSFKPPSVCIIPEGVAYERISLDDDVLVIHFNIVNFIMEDIEVYKITDAEKYHRLFAKALQLRFENMPGAQYLETAVLYEIIGELQRDFGNFNTSGGNVAETAEYMKQNFFNPELTIDSLAKRANVSPAQYRRKFRQLYGESPKQYLDSLRFNYAKSLLETGYFTQKEIAFRCGFSGVEYFRTAFKKETGKCISEFAKIQGSSD